MKFLSEQIEEFKFLTESTDENKEPEYFLEGVFLQANIKNRNGRIYPLDIMKKEVDRYREEYVNRKRAFGELNHPCFWDKTKALTKYGWKLIKDCQVGEEVYSINPESGQLELKKITAVNINHYTGKMLRFKNRTIDTVVTPYHRFLVQTRTGFKFMRAHEIKDNFVGTQVRTYKIPKIAVSGLDRDNQFFTIPGLPEHKNPLYHDDLVLSLYHFAGFIGFWLAEGHASKDEQNRRQVGLSQRKEENFPTIRELIANIPVVWHEYVKQSDDHKDTYSWITTDARLHAFLEPLGKCYSKYIPSELLDVLNEEQAAYLLEMFILGDGTQKYFNDKKSTSLGFSTSRRLIEDLSIVSLMAGQAFRLWEEGYNMMVEDREIEGYHINKENLRQIHALTFLKSSGVYLDHNHMTIEEIDWDDDVYCLTVEDNSTFYAMDNGYGFWTGNCNPSINLDRVSHIITDIWQEGDFFKARAKILDTPLGNIVKAMIKEGCQLGVSSRAMGSVTRRNGVDYVGDDFRLVTAGDIVWEPSAQTAFPKGLMEDVEWEYDEATDSYIQVASINESTEPQVDVQALSKLQIEKFEQLLQSLKTTK